MQILTLSRAKEDTGLLLTAFVDSLAGQDKAKSAAAYVGDVDRFARWIAGKYGHFDPVSVSTVDVVEYRAYLQSQKGYRGKSMAPATVNRALVGLRVFFEWLKTTGQVKDNPAVGVKQVAMSTRPAPKWLTRNHQTAPQ